MPTLLHLDASPRGHQSISRKISAAIVAAWKNKNADGRVIERDLNLSDIQFVDVNWIDGVKTSPDLQTDQQRKAVGLSDELVGELLNAEIIVIGTPMYNFAIPANLKAWVDHIVRPGKTFTYGPNGPQGLAAGRKAVIAVASGGVYAGTPMEAYDMEIPYLRHILGFVGITDVQFIQAGGTNSVTTGKVPAAEFLAPYLEQVNLLFS